MKHHVIRITILCLLVLFGSSALCRSWTKPLANGITLTQIIDRPSAPNSVPSKIINILRIDPKVNGVKVAAILAKGHTYGTDRLKGRSTVSSIAKSVDAVAAVNAGYFWQSADPLSLHVERGELVSEPLPGRASFGITSDGRLLFDTLKFEGRLVLPDGSGFPIRGVNRLRGKDELIVYTPRFSESTCSASGGSEVIIKYDGSPISPGIPMVAVVSEVRNRCGDSKIEDRTLILSGSGLAAAFIDQNLKPGAVVSIDFKLKPTNSADWNKVIEAVGGGPWLVKDGVRYIDAEEEGIKPDIYKGRHARTAVGATEDGKLVIVTVGGWQRTGGMTLQQLADLMLSQGCQNAINLDGGGSSTMATPFGLLNCPTDLSERSVADALAVFGNPSDEVLADNRIPAEPDRSTQGLISRAGSVLPVNSQSANPVSVPDFIVSPSAPPLIEGYPYRCMLLESSTGRPLDPRIADQAVWTLSGGLGFIDQLGTFYAARAGTGNISARIGSKTISVPVEVFAGRTGKFNTKFTPDPTDMVHRSILTVTLTDQAGAPIKNRRVVFTIKSGTPEHAEAETSENGEIAITITWSELPGVTAASVLLESGEIPSLEVPRPK